MNIQLELRLRDLYEPQLVDSVKAIQAQTDHLLRLHVRNRNRILLAVAKVSDPRILLSRSRR
jgi:hypothetical protein